MPTLDAFISSAITFALTLAYAWFVLGWRPRP